MFLLDLFVIEILPMRRDLETLYDDVYWSHGMYTWRCMIYIRCDCWEILYMHVDVICWRRSVYFLNLCFIRVFYRFNINRALQQVS